jgi:hypothetical protein
VFTSEHTTINPLNGIWAGNAQIKGVGVVINLPENSTVGGDPLTGVGTSLIIDPDKTFFKEIQVNNDLSVVAMTFGDSVNFLSGSGVGLSVSSGADSITFSNTGVLSVAAGSGITAATVSGAATITNAGVRSLQSTTALPSGRSTGAGINITGSVGDNLRITNAGVISISSGVGITVSADAATGDVTITNSAPAVNAFTQVVVNGDTSNILAADAVSDALNINSGEGITLSKTVGTDTLTIAVNPVFDLKGSVFGDDSSILVDALSNYIYGNVSATTLRTAEARISLGSGAGSATSGTAIAIGSFAGATNQNGTGLGIGFRAAFTDQGASSVAIGVDAGKTTQGANGVAIGNQAGETTQGSIAVAIGQEAGNTSQGSAGVAIGYYAGKSSQESGAVAIGYTAAQITQRTGAVAIGWSAGQTNQGANAIAIGYRAGFTNQNASSIVLNASGVALEAAAAGFFVNPLRFSSSSAKALMYDAATSELIYSSVLEFVGSTISTSDSSGLTVDVQTTFNTDVTVENDLNVTQRLRVQGSRVINISELQTIVAASADFAAFKTAIAALA